MIRQSLHPRANPIDYPVGSLSFHFQETSFMDYVKEYYQSKHPEQTLPEEGHSSFAHSSIERVKVFYDHHQQEFILFSGYFVLQCLYPSHIPSICLTETIGQLLESAIIADRVYYLQKHGASVQVHCAFDRRQSPRCMCITARKWPVCSANTAVHLFS